MSIDEYFGRINRNLQELSVDLAEGNLAAAGPIFAELKDAIADMQAFLQPLPEN